MKKENKMNKTKVFGILIFMLTMLVALQPMITANWPAIDGDPTNGVNTGQKKVDELEYPDPPQSDDDDDPYEELFNALIGPTGEPGGVFILYDHNATDDILYSEIIYGTYDSEEGALLYFSITIEESTIIDQFELQAIIDEMEDPVEQAQAQADYDAILAAGQVPELEIVLYSTTDGYDGSYVQFVATSMGFVLPDSTRRSVPFIHEVGDDTEDFYYLYVDSIIPEGFFVLEEGIETQAIQAVDHYLIPLGAQAQSQSGECQCPNPAYQQCIDDCHSDWDPIVKAKERIKDQKQEDERRARSNVISKLKIFRDKAASIILKLLAHGYFAIRTMGISELIAWLIDEGLFDYSAELEAAKQDVLNAKWAWDDAKAALQQAWDDYGNAIEGRLICLQECEQIPKTIPCPCPEPATQPATQTTQ